MASTDSPNQPGEERWRFGIRRRPMGAEFALHVGVWPATPWNPHRFLDVRLGWVRFVAGWVRVPESDDGDSGRGMV